MKNGLFIKNGITIPNNELEIIASRSGGPGGQNVNKANTKVTIRWNIKNSSALSEDQKEKILLKLKSRLSQDGELIVYNNVTRSQIQNKKLALLQIIKEVNKALYISKKRKATKISKTAKEARLKEKSHISKIKKLRRSYTQD